MRKVLDAFEVSDNEVEINRCLYREYVTTHIENVRKGYQKFFVPLCNNDSVNPKYFTKQEMIDAIVKLGNHVLLHDATKWSPEEFEPYRYKFYPTKQEKSDPNYNENMKRVFAEGWKHHHENNEHHLNHWCEDGINRDMPLDYIFEMICDWYAMSVYFKSSIVEWYEKDAKKERAMMTEKTKNIVDDLLYNVLKDKIF